MRPNPVLSVLIPGALATLTSSAALSVLSRAEGHAPLQPLNATSHWRHGAGAARVTRADLPHTGVGLATHFAATLFWAALQEAATRRRPTRLRDALATSAVAAVVDYTITPKRFTPGWEFVLSKRAMAGAYLAMAAGLYAGVRLVRR